MDETFHALDEGMIYEHHSMPDLMALVPITLSPPGSVTRLKKA